MHPTKGTPRTLEEAIRNGLEEYGFINNEKIIQALIPHIRDFMAQKAIHKDYTVDAAFKIYFRKVFPEAS